MSFMTLLERRRQGVHRKRVAKRRKDAESVADGDNESVASVSAE
jgi:hypothetical protein